MLGNDITIDQILQTTSKEIILDGLQFYNYIQRVVKPYRLQNSPTYFSTVTAIVYLFLLI